MNFKDVERIWNDWFDSHTIDKKTFSEAISLVVAVGNAVAKENGFASMEDAIGHLDPRIEFGIKAMAAFKLLEDFIDKNSAN